MTTKDSQRGRHFELFHDGEFEADPTERWGIFDDIDGLARSLHSSCHHHELRLKGQVYGRLRDWITTRQWRPRPGGFPVLRLYDFRGVAIGSFGLPGFVPTGWDEANRVLTAEIDSAGALSREELAFWLAFSEGLVTETGQWRHEDAPTKAARLAVVRQMHRQPVRSWTHSTLLIDGQHIRTAYDFYLALGEAVHGVGGYYGANLDALEDCLRGGFGLEPPFTLRWINFAVSQRHLDRRWLDTVLEIFKDRGVQLVTDT